MRIKLHIKCHCDDEKTEQLRDMGIEMESTTEFRPFSIDPEVIMGFYPDKEGGCFIMVGDTELTINESFNELDEILNNLGL